MLVTRNTLENWTIVFFLKIFPETYRKQIMGIATSEVTALKGELENSQKINRLQESFYIGRESLLNGLIFRYQDMASQSMSINSFVSRALVQELGDSKTCSELKAIFDEATNIMRKMANSLPMKERLSSHLLFRT